MKKLFLFTIVIVLFISACGCVVDDEIDKNNVSITYSTASKADNASSVVNSQVDINSEKDNGLNEDFKSAMDSYEKFMNEYVSFMKKYSENPTDMSLLSDYANYISKYADFVEDFEEWENEELNEDEIKYYIEVQTRVSKKLLEVSK